MRKKLLKGLIAVAGALVLGLLLVSPAQAAAKAPVKTMAKLATRHTAHGLDCATCHGKTKKPGAVDMEKCLECHDNQELATKTADLKPTNPHNTRHYGIWADCNLCHHEHKVSENHCLGCHPTFNFKVP
nr:cytochrome c3 family protein [uncultured Holophaga sp.]